MALCIASQRTCQGPLFEAFKDQALKIRMTHNSRTKKEGTKRRDVYLKENMFIFADQKKFETSHKETKPIKMVIGANLTGFYSRMQCMLGRKTG